MNDIRLDVLTVGSIEREGKRILEAHSGSTMIRNGERTVVVDTGSRERRDSILHSLEELGVDPEDVDTVVITHMHDDHTGNTDLFPNARFIAHTAESPPSSWERAEEGMELIPGVWIVHTPGHSRGSISVFVDADRHYVIAGDALPVRDNYLKNLPPGIHYDRGLAMESIKRIVDFADVVVPGHDFPFSV